MFREDAYKIRSTDTNIANLDQLFSVIMNKNEESHSKSSHNLWRIKRMKPARILRTLFPAPKTLPEHAGIDIERFISFDVNGGVPYQLPSTDCSNMFVYQAIGSRIIHLQPTTECTDKCRRVTVKLKQSHTCAFPSNIWYYWIARSINHIRFVFQCFTTGGITNQFQHRTIRLRKKLPFRILERIVDVCKWFRWCFILWLF